MNDPCLTGLTDCCNEFPQHLTATITAGGHLCDPPPVAIEWKFSGGSVMFVNGELVKRAVEMITHLAGANSERDILAAAKLVKEIAEALKPSS